MIVTNFSKEHNNKINNVRENDKVFTFDDITAKIADSSLRYKEQPNGIRCQCPVHGGEKLSLSIKRTDDGRFSAKCFSHNCNYHDIVTTIMGTTMPTPKRTVRRPVKKRSTLTPFKTSADIVAIYPYKSTNDVTLFQKLRLETHNPDGTRKQYKKHNRLIDTPKYVVRHQIDGVWYYGKGNCDPILYNTPELVSAETVYICEGEKDADNLNAGLKELGLFGRIVATTTYDGAGGKWHATYTQQVAGKSIVIFPDLNDEDQQGEKHAEKIARALVCFCPTVKIAFLPNDGEKGFDVSDYLATHTIAELQAVAIASAEYVVNEDDFTEFVSISADSKVIRLDEANGIYLNDVLTSFEMLPPFCSLTSYTGSRKTSTAIKLINELGWGIYVTSGVMATRAIAEKQRVNGWGVWYQGEKQLARKIVCTYDSLPAVIQAAAEAGYDFSKIPLVIDESHNFAVAGYRLKTLKKASHIIRDVQFKNILLLSGTPLPIWSPAFERFEEVKVESGKRVQKVQLVDYHKEVIDEDGKVNIVGTMLNALAVLTLMHLARKERVLIRLDSKGSQLDSLIARLIEGGISANSIFTLNADNKLESFGQLLATQETVPPELRVMIVTATFVESSNLLSDFGTIISHTDIHPVMNEQLFNRKRGEAVPLCYLLNGGLGRGYEFDRDKEREAIMSMLTHLCNVANSSQLNNLTEDEVRVFGRDYSKGMTKNEEGQWEICPLGLTQMVYESETLYFAQNPSAYVQWVKKQSGYRWQWLPKETLAIENEELPKELLKRTKAIKEDLSDLRSSQYGYVCCWLDGLSESERAKAEAQKIDGLSRRLADRAIEIDFALFERGESADTWHDAVRLLFTLGRDSTARYNHLMRLFEIDKLKKEGSPLFDLIVESFQGKTMTQKERHATLLELYRKIPNLEVFTHELFLRYWSTEKRAILTPKMADNLLRCIFDITKSRETKGERARAWRFNHVADLNELLDKAREVSFCHEVTTPVMTVDVHWQLDKKTDTENPSSKLPIIKENNELGGRILTDSAEWDAFVAEFDALDDCSPDSVEWDEIDALNELLRSQVENPSSKLPTIKENNELCGRILTDSAEWDAIVAEFDALDDCPLTVEWNEIDTLNELLRSQVENPSSKLPTIKENNELCGRILTDSAEWNAILAEFDALDDCTPTVEWDEIDTLNELLWNQAESWPTKLRSIKENNNVAEVSADGKEIEVETAQNSHDSAESDAYYAEYIDWLKRANCYRTNETEFYDDG